MSDDINDYCPGCGCDYACFCRTCAQCRGHRTARSRTDQGTLCEKCIRARLTIVDGEKYGFSILIEDRVALRATWKHTDWLGGWTFEMTIPEGNTRVARERRISVNAAKAQAVYILRGWLMEVAPNSRALRFMNGLPL